MVKARTRVKFLRRLGITLIVLPELVTTPFGVALVLAARYLAKRYEASQNSRLRETVKYYLAHTGRFSDDVDSESGDLSSVTRYTLSEERAILGQITGRRSFEANIAPSTLQNWRDMRDRTVHHATDIQSLSGRYKDSDSSKVESGWLGTSRKEDGMIHHTMNMKQLSQRYENASAVAHSNWARASAAGEGVTHHSLNMNLLSQRYQTGSLGQTKVKYHTINKALLRQRYGSAVSSTTAVHALRDNNYYYDIVSKGNVIGGYQCSVATNADISGDRLKKGKSTKREGEKYLHFRYAFMNV